MADIYETVEDLLQREQWSACADQSALALTQGEWSREQKAFLNFARSRSLSKLGKATSALEPGRLALYLAEEGEDFDFIGKAILNLALILHRIPGMERSTVEVQRRFFDFFPRYKSMRDRYLTAQFNLGVYLRAAGMYEDALAQFDRTYREALKRGDTRVADMSRNSATWEALRLERIPLAESLIRAGEPYNTPDPIMQASHFIDLAQLSYLKQNYPAACGYAYRAATLCKDSDELCARALEILNRVSDRTGDPKAALLVGLLAKLKAEKSHRRDIAGQAAASIRNLALRHPEVLEILVPAIDGQVK